MIIPSIRTRSKAWRFCLPVVWSLTLFCHGASNGIACEDDRLNTTVVRVDSPVLKTIDAITVPAQVAGVLSELAVKEGSVVKKGDLIGRIDDSVIKGEIAKSQLAIHLAKLKSDDTTDLRMAEKSAMVANNEYQRALDANRRVKDVYPENEIDRLKLLLDRATLEIEKAQKLKTIATTEWDIAIAEGNRLQTSLERHSIHATSHGMIVGIERRAGEWCDLGSALIKMVRTDVLRIEGLVSASEASQLTLGMQADVKVTLTKDQLVDAKGTLVFVSPDVNPISGQVRVFLELIVTDKRIRPGLRPVVELQISDQSP
jgi:multidrug efflux pump subunit AcrA (membrane-fusion protein)